MIASCVSALPLLKSRGRFSRIEQQPLAAISSCRGVPGGGI